jgi:hypothetical protein
MDLLLKCGLAIGTVVIIAIIFLITSYIFYSHIYLTFKHRSAPIQADELVKMLTAIMNLEVEIYEKNIFVKRGALTNATFENYYHNMMDEILASLSGDFMYRINFYIKQEAVVTIIARTVRQYLTDKIVHMEEEIGE